MGRRRNFLGLLLVLALIFVACGQKPGVHVATRGVGGEGFGDLGLGAEGEILEEGEAGAAGGAGAAGTGRSGQTGAGGGATGTQPGADRTGISDEEIKIGIHAPVSGAAPFPATQFQRALNVYWDQRRQGGAPKIHGRGVELIFKDDHYDPFTAVDRCRAMAEQDQVFMLAGGGGTDQIQACARFAASRGIPYLSAGTTEIGLVNFKNYFAISMSYKQQGALLAQLIKSHPELAPRSKVAMIRTNTPNFQDAHDGFIQAVNQIGGREVVLDRTMSKNPSATEYDQVARDIGNSGAQAVYFLVAPVHYIQVTAATRYPPQNDAWFVGVGITKGLNAVLSEGCATSAGRIERAMWFSPFPGLEQADNVARGFMESYRAVNNAEPDDLGLAFWGFNMVIHQMLENAGRDLTRRSFIATTEQSSIKTGLFPDLNYSPRNHFGADSVHLLRPNCQGARSTWVHRTEPPLFRKSF